MHIIDNRTRENAQRSKTRDTKDITTIVLHQLDKKNPQQRTHYRVGLDGTIEYAVALEEELFVPTSLDVGLEGAFEDDTPPRVQLQALADLLSYLLIHRAATPWLHDKTPVFNAAEAAVHFSLAPALPVPQWKTWKTWKPYILGQKTFSQPAYLAEFLVQRPVPPVDDMILPREGILSLQVVFRNNGDATWVNYGEQAVKLNVIWEAGTSSAKQWKKYGIPEGSSLFSADDWEDAFCAGVMQERTCPPLASATFHITLAGNGVAPGRYRESFGLAHGTEWIDNCVNGSPAGIAQCWFAFDVI